MVTGVAPLPPEMGFRFCLTEGSAFPSLVDLHHELRGNTSLMYCKCKRIWYVARFKCCAIFRHSTEYFYDTGNGPFYSAAPCCCYCLLCSAPCSQLLCRGQRGMANDRNETLVRRPQFAASPRWVRPFGVWLHSRKGMGCSLVATFNRHSSARSSKGPRAKLST